MRRHTPVSATAAYARHVGFRLSPTKSDRRLHGKLRAGGMAELAASIRGHNGRYILEM